MTGGAPADSSAPPPPDPSTPGQHVAPPAPPLPDVQPPAPIPVPPAPGDQATEAAPPTGPPPPPAEGDAPVPPPPAPPGRPAPGAARSRRVLFTAIGTGVAVIGLAVGSVLVDTALGLGKTSRGLSLSSRDVGRLSHDELRAAVDQVADDVAARPVTLRAVAGEMSVPAGQLGLALDRPAVVAAAQSAGQDGFVLLRPFQVLRSWFVDDEVPLGFSVDRNQAGRGAAELAKGNERPPTEPGVALKGDAFAVVPGIDGQQLDVDGLAARLVEMAAQSPEGPWSVDLPFRAVPPRYPPSAAARLVDRANGLAKTPLTVTAGGKRATMSPQKVRSWLRAVPVEAVTAQGGPDAVAPRDAEAGLVLQADVDMLVRDVTAAIGNVGSPPTEADFKVVGDRIEVVPGKAGTKCCAPDSGTRVAEAVLAGRTSVTLDLTEAPAKQDATWAQKMGIKEKVATFTTRHPAGQPRVTNIHKAAETIRGTVIEPGGSFSLNRILGPRTKEKGYVEAPVIYESAMSMDIGGGVSQLATTLFNTAFFAGMEFSQYQSHTLYIDRYPYGREATVSYPSPDLAFRNPSPHGILVWTSYDDTQITVMFFSTKWVTAEQTGQSKEPYGPGCTRVKTERTLTFPNGKKQVGSVTAVYQPNEGVSCFGGKPGKPEDKTRPPDKGADPGPPPTSAAPAPTTRPQTTATTAAPAASNP
jgi:vancomycin resistance protein YoaR